MNSDEVSTFHKLHMNRRSTTKLGLGVNELCDEGFAVRHLAAMWGVNVYTVQKWRREGTGWFTEVMQVAHLLATVDMLKELGVERPAAWFETPLVEGSSLTPVEVYPKDPALLLDYASGQTPREKVLDIHDPGWRRRSPSKWEVYEADDGDLAIRPRDAESSGA